MDASRSATALVVTAALFSTVFAGVATAASHAPLSVTLWNSSAEGLTAGQTYTVWAQVGSGIVPTNVSNITVRVGLGVINNLFPATNYTPAYAGSPGLYRATVSVTALETTVGITGIAVFVRQGGDSADNYRIVGFTPIPFGGPPASGWTLSVGVENLPQLGRTVDPGEKIVWRIDTYNNGVHANAPSLKAQLFASPNVDFTETPTDLTPASAGTGVYIVENTVPAGISVGRQFVLQASLNETNFAMGNASADVWMLEAIVSYMQHNATLISGVLTVGDGVAAVAGADVAVWFTEIGVPSHTIGSIQGQTNATGKIAFSIPNDGTQDFDVRGWANSTARSQYVAGQLYLRPTYTPLSPVSTRFDAIAQEDLTTIPWDGQQTMSFQFFANGTLWSSRSVVAIVSTSRGILGQDTLTTDASGKANFTVDFDQIPLAGDDLVNGGINFTFRAATGIDASTSDGFWWGEDLELVSPDFQISAIKQVFDMNLSFTTEPFEYGSPFGVAFQYTGPKNIAGYKGATVISPAGLSGLFGGYTPNEDLWTGHGQAFIGVGVRAAAPEYYGSMLVPTYWPSSTYALIAAVVPSYSILGSGGDPTLIAALSWTTISPGEALSGFLPSPDTAPPQIFSPDDFTIDMHQQAYLWTNAYDNSLDFGDNGTYRWDFVDPSGVPGFVGNGVTFDPPAPGNYTIMVTVADASGNTATHNFTITVRDVDPPSVDAGIDLTAFGGTMVNFTGVALDDDVQFQNPASLVNYSFMYNGSQVVINPDRAYPNVMANFTFWTLGVYNVTLTAEDAAGHSANDSFLVAIISPDTIAPTVDAGLDRTVNASQSASFNGTASDNFGAFPLGAACGWTFTYNGSIVNISGDDFAFTFWTLGTYDLEYGCTDFWNNTGRDTIRVTVDRPDKEAPVVIAGADQSVMAGDTVTLNGQASDNDPAFVSAGVYWWIFSDGATPRNLSGPAVSYVFQSAGDYTMTLFARDPWGNAGSDTLVVHVLVPDTTDPVIAAIPDMTVDQGLTAAVQGDVSDNDPTFLASGNISWTFTVGGTPQARYGPSFSFLFALAGDYTITVTAMDAAGNTATRTFVIHVLAPDTTPPTVNATADDLTVEAGTLVSFTGSASDGGFPITNDQRFNWTFTYNGTVQRLVGRSAEFRFEIVGNYAVTLSVTDALGNVGTQSFTVAVSEKTTTPPPPPTTAPTDLTVPLLLLVLVSGGIGAFLLIRRRPHAPETADVERAPAPSRAPSVGEGDSDTVIEKDLDDLLK